MSKESLPTASSRKVNYRLVADVAFSVFASLAGFVVYRWLHPGAISVPELFTYALVSTVVQSGALIAFGAYGAYWRFFSFPDELILFKAVGSTGLITVAGSIILTPLPPLFLYFDFTCRLALLFAARFACRWEQQKIYDLKNRKLGRRTLIYGAGTAGRSLANKFLSETEVRANIIGFIDDDPDKFGRSFGNISVIANRKTLPFVLKSSAVEELIVAVRGLEGAVLQELLQIAHQFNIRPRMIEEFDFLNQENSRIRPFRDVKLEDLLRRPRREVDLASVAREVAGKTVLVTGAGGSIGSELVRQLIKLDVKRLLVLDNSEYNLYQIDRELTELLGSDKGRAVPLLVDLKDKAGTMQAIANTPPDIVFHAAAYKHVHLVEMNPLPAILNNILGMRNLLEISRELGVSSFVLISSDKAVNPVGVMGATKRVCELLVTNAARRTGKRYCAVRFGNVLGSSGSLIPLLKQKIRNGEPVTVTHQDMTRYFMLIKEAVSLVLKAGSISSPGDINILRMGEPIRILDIAKSLITMLGKTEKDIPIIFTGLRPGEKMFEEMYLCGNEVKTEHEDILVMPEGDSVHESGEKIEAAVDEMIRNAQAGSALAVEQLRALAAHAPRVKAEPSKKPA